MPQLTDQQVETTKRVAAKLHAFYDDLAAEERLMFALGVRRLVAHGEETDTQGYRIREEEAAPPLPPADRDGGLIFGRFLDPLPIGYKFP